MRLIHLVAIVTFAFGAPPVAAAQTSTPGAAVARASADRPVTPQEVRAAQTAADDLIREAEASAFFINVTDGASPVVRHTQSGLTCEFPLEGRQNRIFVISPDGSDVACGSVDLGIHHTLYATRYTTTVSAEDALVEASDAIVERYPSAKPYEGEAFTISVEYPDEVVLPPTYRATFTIELDGGAAFTSVSTALHDGWILKQRVTAPKLDEAIEAQLYSATLWNAALASLVDETD